ncbi:MAG: YggS family pyridoxal phosphate-dependent enzyme [Deltaproteobacteria bacterium]|nr:YggS family pyridoxal phosphate-dependent enzyme [Deltaproteobacteria bacterium]MBW2447381.1 YggS family pyridoxal phosphate-dependent enzyme [Deltaproteobacteria bacterium]
MSEVAERLAGVRERIARAAARAGRDPDEVALVGVSKRKPAEAIVAAVAAGLGNVGENYVQEAVAKLPDVRAAVDAQGLALPRFHFVGQLQRNKARDVVAHFDCVESVDRASLARALDAKAEAADRRLSVLLQVDLSDEPGKGGASPEALPDLLAACAALSHLSVDGLMAVPAPGRDAEASRPAFSRLRELRDRLREAPGGGSLRELSMGMSGDFEVAIEEGATLVRVGTAIFGPREN